MHTNPIFNRATNRGFTIVEMVVAIVVSAIMAIGMVQYIGDSVTGIQTSTARNQLATAGRVAIERIAMELHNALPNSIRASGADPNGDQCIEFVPVRAATSYIDPPFGGGGGDSFDVVDFTPSQEGTTGGYAVIYPNDIDEIYDGENATTTGFPFRGPIEEIDTIEDTAPTSDASTITLLETHRFRRRSPFLRFFLVDQPVSFCVSGDKLYRYTRYGFQSTQPDAEGAGDLPAYNGTTEKILITDSIDNAGLTAFTVSPQSLTRNALISIKLKMTSGADSVDIVHETLTRSVP